MGTDQLTIPFLSFISRLQVTGILPGFSSDISVKSIGIEILRRPRLIGNLIERTKNFCWVTVAIKTERHAQ